MVKMKHLRTRIETTTTMMMMRKSRPDAVQDDRGCWLHLAPYSPQPTVGDGREEDTDGNNVVLRSLGDDAECVCDRSSREGRPIDRWQMLRLRRVEEEA